MGLNHLMAKAGLGQKTLSWLKSSLIAGRLARWSCNQAGMLDTSVQPRKSMVLLPVVGIVMLRMCLLRSLRDRIVWRSCLICLIVMAGKVRSRQSIGSAMRRKYFDTFDMVTRVGRSDCRVSRIMVSSSVGSLESDIVLDREPSCGLRSRFRLS
jgi:hypothetical protein